MFDRRLRLILDPFLVPVATRLKGLGVSANTVTAFGFLVGLGGAVALAYRIDLLALGLILMSRVMDALDGLIARQSAPTAVGGFLDIVADFIFYDSVIFGYAIGRPEDALYAAMLLFSFTGTGSSFLAFAAVSASSGPINGAWSHVVTRKSITYLSGITEGGETIILLSLICLYPEYFVFMALFFSLFCWLTTISRIVMSVRLLAGR